MKQKNIKIRSTRNKNQEYLNKIIIYNSFKEHNQRYIQSKIKKTNKLTKVKILIIIIHRYLVKVPKIILMKSFLV